MIAAVFVVALALAAAPPSAGVNTYGFLDTPAFRACMDRETTDLGMRTCVGDETGRWDARLNAAYRTLTARLSPREREALRGRERAWIAAGRHACTHAGDDEAGGTLQIYEVAECEMTRTQTRAAELEARMARSSAPSPGHHR